MQLFILIIVALNLFLTSLLAVKLLMKKGLRTTHAARRRVFVDTSTLMDGRILALAKAGFLSDEVLVPRSVIRELQLLADGPDSEKRARARYGLDVVNELERLENAEVSVYADAPGSRIKVDERLLELAHENDALILTNDFNLAKVAATEDILAININDLAQGLRSEYLPGDHMSVQIISAGSNPKQGVAYLPDGTMVVVDDAERFVGSGIPLEIEFIRYLQTNAGKMMFAKIAKEEETTKTPKQKKVNGRKPIQQAVETIKASVEKTSSKKAVKPKAKSEANPKKKSSKTADQEDTHEIKADQSAKKKSVKTKPTTVTKDDGKGKAKKKTTPKAAKSEPKKTRKKKTRESKAEDSLLGAIEQTK